MITLTYGGGVASAAFAGVLAAPIYSVNPNMGDNFINTVFAVVVIGGMGSIMGAIITGFGLGVIEGLTKVFYPAGLGHRRVPGHGDRAAAPCPTACSGGAPECSVSPARSRSPSW